MNDHETVLTKQLRSQLIEERRDLEAEYFRRMPLNQKIHSFAFAIVFVGGIFFGVGLIGFILYKLIFRHP